jgi:metal-responsive CopG/Arc/MetJ family transcriptional regulator
MLHLNITIPEDLKEELDKEVKRERTQRSTLIQKAVRAYLEIQKRRSLQELMKEGYLAEANADRAVSREWETTLEDRWDG